MDFIAVENVESVFYLSYHEPANGGWSHDQKFSLGTEKVNKKTKKLHSCYSETLLNGRPSTVDIHDIMDMQL